MKRYLKSKLVKTLAVVIVLGLAGSWAVSAVLDRQEVAKMTEKMKTVCVGRFLIDLPAEAQVSLIRPTIDGFDIGTFDETDDAFWARVAAREAEIRAKPDRLGGNKNMESVRDVKTDSGLVGKIFVHSRTVTEGQSSDGLTVEHYRDEGVDVEAHVHAKGISIDLSAKDMGPKYIENLPRLVAKLVANPGNRIPTEPGYCLDRAYVRDPLTANQGERLTMGVDLPSHPDIDITLIQMAGIKPARQSLLERNADWNSKLPLAERMRGSDLRAAPRTIGNLVGDELVQRFILGNGLWVYSFWWEVSGVEDNVFIPYFSFRMIPGTGDRGQQVPSSLSEGAAMALWDKITNSIRIRPTESPKVSAAEPPTASLGTIATAGETCPFTGYWQCNEGGNGLAVLGGQHQYLRKGQRMPQALLLSPQTLWEKVRGVQSSFENKTKTLWRMVDRRSRERIAPTIALDQARPGWPTAFAATTCQGPAEKAEIGSYVATGSPCPSSGWWRSEDSKALDGTRWFAQGSLLPAATFAVPPGAFGKSADAPKAIQRRAKWQLMRLAQAPDTSRGTDGSCIPTTRPDEPDSEGASTST